MSFGLSQSSRRRLLGVHPALVAVVEAAITRSPVDFMITEGVRTYTPSTSTNVRKWKAMSRMKMISTMRYR